MTLSMSLRSASVSGRYLIWRSPQKRSRPLPPCGEGVGDGGRQAAAGDSENGAANLFGMSRAFERPPPPAPAPRGGGGSWQRETSKPLHVIGVGGFIHERVDFSFVRHFDLHEP